MGWVGGVLWGILGSFFLRKIAQANFFEPPKEIDD